MNYNKHISVHILLAFFITITIALSGTFAYVFLNATTESKLTVSVKTGYWAKVKVNLDFNDGTPVSTIELDRDGTYGDLPEIDMPGYIFTGWYTSQENGNKVTSSSPLITTEDHTLYARYTPNYFKNAIVRNAYPLDTATYPTGGEAYTFNMPATEQLGAVTEYRYIGTNPDNYVLFNCDDDGDNCELWRIVGVFETQTTAGGPTEQRIKLVRNSSIGSLPWDSNGLNNWPTSSIKTLLNEGDYYNRSGDYTSTGLSSDAKSKIDTVVYYLGSTSTEKHTPKSFYEFERGTDVYSGNDTTWIGKVGIIYPSDIGLATNGNLSHDRNACLNDDWYLSSCCFSTYLSSYERLTLASEYHNDKLNVYEWAEYDPPYWYTKSDNVGEIFPTVYLKNDVIVYGGTGSSTDPYVINNIEFTFVTLNFNNGSTDGKIFIKGNTYFDLPTPTKAGYNFAGWYTASTGGTEIINGDTLISRENHTLYAHWNPATFTVTFDPNKGNTSTSTKNVVRDSTYGTLPTPTRSGATFMGWYTSQAGGSRVTSSTKVSLIQNQTLYAHWKLPLKDEIISKSNPLNSTDFTSKEIYTFNQPATEQLGAVTEYRYIGSNPNNYVRFNCNTSNSCYTWRIIGIFETQQVVGGATEQRIKLVRNGSIGSTLPWDSNGLNNWPTSSLKTLLNEGDYYNGINTYSSTGLKDSAKLLISDAVYYLGGSNTHNDVTPSMFYERERGTTVYSGRTTAWIGKVGLMYPSDYGLATSGGDTLNRAACLSKELYNWNSGDYKTNCSSNSYLHFGNSNKCTMTPDASRSDEVFWVYGGNQVNSYRANSYCSIYPVVYLKADILTTDGDGTSSHPYIISEP